MTLLVCILYIFMFEDNVNLFDVGENRTARTTGATRSDQGVFNRESCVKGIVTDSDQITVALTYFTTCSFLRVFF